MELHGNNPQIVAWIKSTLSIMRKLVVEQCSVQDNFVIEKHLQFLLGGIVNHRKYVMQKYHDGSIPNLPNTL